jgi:hypothetical protein
MEAGGMTRRQRIVYSPVVAIVTGALALWLAHTVVQGVHSCSWDEYPCASGDLPQIMAILAAVAGFWFSWTGRLTRLFREVT